MTTTQPFGDLIWGVVGVAGGNGGEQELPCVDVGRTRYVSKYQLKCVHYPCITASSCACRTRTSYNSAVHKYTSIRLVVFNGRPFSPTPFPPPFFLHMTSPSQGITWSTSGRRWLCVCLRLHRRPRCISSAGAQEVNRAGPSS